MAKNRGIEMTRDEAIAAVDGVEPFHLPGTRREQNELLVKKLEVLGLLKLDEPKTAEDKLWDELASVSRFDRSDSMLKRAIDRAGLKIVEK
jgi:hypothetical protein